MLNIRKGVKWSDGQALTAADVVYSLTAGKQNPVMDVIGLYRPATNIVSVKQVGQYGVAITLKTPDSQFIAATLNPQEVVPQHIFSKVADIATWTIRSGRLRPVHADHALHGSGLRPLQEPALLDARSSQGAVPRVRAGHV